MAKATVVFLLSVALFVVVHAQSHNVSWGTRNPNDIHIQRVIVHKKSSFLRKVSDDYEFNLKSTPYVRAISQITVTDQYTNGNGGYATLAYGGPMTTTAKIHFTSQRGHGFNFIVDIYGR